MKLRPLRPLIIFSVLLWILLSIAGCNKITSPSPLDGIWLVESVENNSGLPLPEYAEKAGAVYWEFQNVIFRITYKPGPPESYGLTTALWGYPSFHRDVITFERGDENMSQTKCPVPGGTELSELRLRYETAHGRLTLFGEGYEIHLVRR